MKSLCLFALLLLASCAPAGKLSTPSGRPEVTVRGVAKQQIRDLCAAVMMRDGYSAEGNTLYALHMVKREEGTLFQPIGDIHEATFNFAELGGVVTIYYKETETIYPETKSQKYIEKNTQEELEEQQNRLEVIAAEARRLNPEPDIPDRSRKL
jgi:hypothetical protein